MLFIKWYDTVDNYILYSIKVLLEEIGNKSTLLNMCIAQVLRWKAPRDNQRANFVDVFTGNIFD